MHFLRLRAQTLNFAYLIRTADLDGPDRPIRVVMIPGEPIDFVGDDADRIRRKLAELDPDPTPADGENITDRVVIRWVVGSGSGGDPERRSG